MTGPSTPVGPPLPEGGQHTSAGSRTAPPAEAISSWPAAIENGDQLTFPVVFMRGGTSRGAFIRAEHLPVDPDLRDRAILALFGSPDARQIDGIGGGTPPTSKLAIISPSRDDHADVDYLFAQVGVNEAIVDFGGNCGNILAGVGPYAIDEGMVAAVEPITRVRVRNVNSGQVIGAEVPVADGRARTSGDARIAGVPRPGASILLDFASSKGVLGRGLLPTGVARQELELANGDRVTASLVDAGNPTVFVHVSELGLSPLQALATTLPDSAVERLRRIREAGAVLLGLASDLAHVQEEAPGVPKAYAVAPPIAYTTGEGVVIAANQLSVIGRGLTLGVPHPAYAATAAICTATASQIPGTIVWDQLSANDRKNPRVRIGHPGGVLPVEVNVEITPGKAPTLHRAGIERTARRLMAGLASVPRDVLQPRGPAV